MKISKEQLLRSLYETGGDTEFFYNRETGAIWKLSFGSLTDENDQEQDIDAFEENEDGFIPLPCQKRINEYGMMLSFTETLPEGHDKESFRNAIHGKGTFRRFRNTVKDTGMTEEWQAFRNGEYEKVAADWCQENQIEAV